MMNFCIFVYKNSLCYYAGNVPGIEGSKDDKTLAPLKNERFSHNVDDLYNLFINNDLVGYSMDYMVKNYFEKNAKIYNNKTNTKELSYDFTVNSLNKYFKGLEQLKKEDYFDCEVYIEKGNLNADTTSRPPIELTKLSTGVIERNLHFGEFVLEYLGVELIKPSLHLRKSRCHI